MALSDEIFNLLKSKYPNIDRYHFDTSISQIIDYAEKLDNTEEPVFWLDYREHTKVEDWNDIKEQIKYDILEKEHSYLGICCNVPVDKDNLTDHQRGVCDAIGLIQHRVHCICDI